MIHEKLGIFFDEEVQRLVDSFTYCFKVRVTVFSAEFEDIIMGFPYRLSDFCQLIRQELHSAPHCIKQNCLMCRQCAGQDTPLIYRCHAGLTESVMPIKVNKAIIGYAMIGQFRTQNDFSQDLKQKCRDAGFDSEALQTAFMALPFFDEPTTQNMINLFSMLTTYIVTREYMNVRRPGLTEQISHWLEEHIAEPVGIDDVAAAMYRSPSTIYHTIKQRLGISFKQLCILKRIERFESIIAAEPDITIREAVARIGYDDPLYFSRVYKKIRLVPPSSYIKSARENPRIPV
jgi:ligand-binding sensor protein